jgi:hypothetical protein
MSELLVRLQEHRDVDRVPDPAVDQRQQALDDHDLAGCDAFLRPERPGVVVVRGFGHGPPGGELTEVIRHQIQPVGVGRERCHADLGARRAIEQVVIVGADATDAVDAEDELDPA